MSETTPQKRQIKVSEVLDLLDNGKDRAAIREELGLSHAEMSALFQHPKLKNKKPRVQPNFVLVDDTEESSVEESAPTAVSQDVPQDAENLGVQEENVTETANAESAPTTWE